MTPISGAPRTHMSRIATAICDTGQRYLSGELFGERPDVAIPEREHRIDPAILQRLRVRRDRLELLA